MVRSIQGERRPLERPWTRRALCRDLALSDVTQSKLAERYGVTDGAITQFKQKHAVEIAAILADSANEFAGILIADKVNRLATYEALLEDAAQVGDGKQAAKLLHAVAEEMGHLPQRVQLSGQVDTQTRYQIDGVNPEDLR